MPMYFNYRNRQVTIFLHNSVAVKFLPGEHKQLAQEGLEKEYASYLRRVDIVKEGTLERKETKPEKGLINEVKQPEPNKELTKEPVEEATKKGRKVIKEGPKLNEGYSPFRPETTVASTSRGEEE
jgi:hypothetical protein